MTPYGEWHAKELELLMKYAGLNELEAIAAGTYNAGLVLNLEGEVGGVKPGMLADLLVVDGDPSQDITILQDHDKIETIILDGDIVEVDRSVKSWPNKPSYTYAGRYLTQEIAREAMGGDGNGRAGGDYATERATVPTNASPTNLPANPIAE
jgi:hypothetical protein